MSMVPDFSFIGPLPEDDGDELSEVRKNISAMSTEELLERCKKIRQSRRAGNATNRKNILPDGTKDKNFRPPKIKNKEKPIVIPSEIPKFETPEQLMEWVLRITG